METYGDSFPESRRPRLVMGIATTPHPSLPNASFLGGALDSSLSGLEAEIAKRKQEARVRNRVGIWIFDFDPSQNPEIHRWIEEYFHVRTRYILGKSSDCSSEQGDGPPPASLSSQIFSSLPSVHKLNYLRTCLSAYFTYLDRPRYDFEAFTADRSTNEVVPLYRFHNVARGAFLNFPTELDTEMVFCLGFTEDGDLVVIDFEETFSLVEDDQAKLLCFCNYALKTTTTDTPETINTQHLRQLQLAHALFEMKVQRQTTVKDGVEETTEIGGPYNEENLKSLFWGWFLDKTPNPSDVALSADGGQWPPKNVYSMLHNLAVIHKQTSESPLWDNLAVWKVREEVLFELFKHLFNALEEWWDVRCVVDAGIAEGIKEGRLEDVEGIFVRYFGRNIYKEHLERIMAVTRSIDFVVRSRLPSVDERLHRYLIGA